MKKKLAIMVLVIKLCMMFFVPVMAENEISKEMSYVNGYYHPDAKVSVPIPVSSNSANYFYTDAMPEQIGDRFGIFDYDTGLVKFLPYGNYPASTLIEYNYIARLDEEYKEGIAAVSNNIAEFETFEILVDGNAPELVAECDEAKTQKGYFEVINAVATDDGCGMYEDKAYSFSYDDAITDWTDKTSFKAEKNGMLFIKARDGLGNIAETEILIESIDDRAPELKNVMVTTDAKSGSGSYGLSANISYSAQDKGVGLCNRPYAIAQGTDAKISELKFTDKADFDVTENGVYIIYAKDEMDNTVAATVNVKTIDKTPPSITVQGNPKTVVNDEVTLLITIKDSEAGLASLWYEDKEVKAKALLGEFKGSASKKAKIKITENGKYVFTAYDTLGNYSEKTVNVTAINRNYKKSSSSSVKADTGKSSSAKTSAADSKSEKVKAIVIGASDVETDEAEELDDSEITLQSVTASTSTKIDNNAEKEEVNSFVIGDMSESYDDESEISDLYEDEPLDENTDSFAHEYSLSGDENITEEYSEGEIQEYEAQGEENVPTIDYPKTVEQEETHSRGVLIFGTIIVIILLVVMAIILVKIGVITLPKSEIYEDIDDDMTEL